MADLIYLHTLSKELHYLISNYNHEAIFVLPIEILYTYNWLRLLKDNYGIDGYPKMSVIEQILFYIEKCRIRSITTSRQCFCIYSDSKLTCYSSHDIESRDEHEIIIWDEKQYLKEITKDDEKEIHEAKIVYYTYIIILNSKPIIYDKGDLGRITNADKCDDTKLERKKLYQIIPGLLPMLAG